MSQPREFRSESAQLYYEHLGGDANGELKAIAKYLREKPVFDYRAGATILEWLHPDLPFAGRRSTAQCDAVTGLIGESQRGVETGLTVRSALNGTSFNATQPIRLAISLPSAPSYPDVINSSFGNLREVFEFGQRLNFEPLLFFCGRDLFVLNWLCFPLSHENYSSTHSVGYGNNCARV